jgi:hypothetical protein
MSWDDPRDDLDPLGPRHDVSDKDMLEAALAYGRAVDAYDREWHLHPARSPEATKLRLDRFHSKWKVLELKRSAELSGQRHILRSIRDAKDKEKKE